MTTPHTEPAPDALERLIAERGWLLGLARRLVRDDARAEDLTQDTLLIAARKPPGAGVTNLRAWAAKVLTNRHKDVLRSEGRRGRREEENARPEREPSTADLFAEAASQASVTQAVVALEEPEREVVMWVYYHGLSVSEAARRMGEPRSTVQSRLDKALAHLRQSLDREHGSRGAWVALFGPWLRMYPEPLPLEPAGPGTAAGSTTGATLKLAAAGVGLAGLGWLGLELAAAPELEHDPQLPAEPLAAAAAVESSSVAASQAERGQGPPVQRAAGAVSEGAADLAAAAEDEPTPVVKRRARVEIELLGADGQEIENASLLLGDGRGRRFPQRFDESGPVVFESAAAGTGFLRVSVGGLVSVLQRIEIELPETRLSVWIPRASLVEVTLKDLEPFTPIPDDLRVLVSDSERLELDPAWWRAYHAAATLGAQLEGRGRPKAKTSAEHLTWLRFDAGRATHAHLVLGATLLETRALPADGGVLHFESPLEPALAVAAGLVGEAVFDGAPASGAVLRLMHDEREIARATADGLGRFELPNLREGHYSLQAEVEGRPFLRFLHLQRGERLDLGAVELRGRLASGRLFGPAGGACAGAIEIELRRADGAVQSARFPVDASGTFRVPAPAGETILVPRGERSGLAGDPFTLSSGRADLVGLELHLARIVQVVIDIPADAPPLSWVRVRPEDAGERPWLVLVAGVPLLELLLAPDHYTFELLDDPSGEPLSATEGYFGPDSTWAQL